MNCPNCRCSTIKMVGEYYQCQACHEAWKLIVDKNRYRHFKGGFYTVICTGTLEFDPDDPDSDMTVYKSDETGKIWIRPSYEFHGYKGGVRRFMPVKSLHINQK